MSQQKQHFQIMGRVCVLLLCLLPVLSSDAQVPTPTPTTPIIEGETEVEVEVESGEIENAAEATANITETATEDTFSTLQDWFLALDDMPTNPILQIIFVLGGVFLLFGAWRYYDLVVLLSGGFVGAALMVSLLQTDVASAQFLVAAFGFVVGVLLAVFVYYAAVFLLGSYVAMLFVIGLADTLGFAGVTPLVLFITWFLGGLLLVVIASELAVLIASLVGAQLVTFALMIPSYWMIPLAVVGAGVQLLLINQTDDNYRRRPRQILFDD